MKTHVMQTGLLRWMMPVCTMILLTCCTGVRESKESVATPAAGTYETANPWPSGYLYYKLDLVREKDRYKGTLLAGNYLGTSQAGGYVNPDILVDCKVDGVMQNDELLLTITVSKIDRMEEGAPDLLAEMNFPMLDSDTTSTLWIFRQVGDQLTSERGPDEEGGKKEVVVWEKIR